MNAGYAIGIPDSEIHAGIDEIGVVFFWLWPRPSTLKQIRKWPVTLSSPGSSQTLTTDPLGLDTPVFKGLISGILPNTE